MIGSARAARARTARKNIGRSDSVRVTHGAGTLRTAGGVGEGRGGGGVAAHAEHCSEEALVGAVFSVRIFERSARDHRDPNT